MSLAEQYRHSRPETGWKDLQAWFDFLQSIDPKSVIQARDGQPIIEFSDHSETPMDFQR